MRLVIQRTKNASVTIDGTIVSAIEHGLMVLVGVAVGDTIDDARWLAAKTVAMRIFDDENGVMNRSVVDVDGEVLAVSQFTLNASTRKGNRPSYIHAAGHDVAVPLYDAYLSRGCIRRCSNDAADSTVEARQFRDRNPGPRDGSYAPPHTAVGSGENGHFG